MRLRCCDLAAAVGLLSLALLGCSSSEEQAALARERASRALAEGRRADALAAIEELRDEGSTSPSATLELASLMIRAGDAPAAAWLLEAALAREPAHDPLRLAFAQTLLLLGDAARARDTLARISGASEQHADGLLVAARAELLLGDLEGSLDLLEQAALRYPDRPESSLLRVAVFTREGRLDEARTALAEAKRAAAQAPLPEDQKVALLAAEVTLLQAGIARDEVEAGLAGLSHLVEANPDEDWLWQSLARAHVRAGRPRPALEKLEQALARAPERVALQLLAAGLQAALGDLDAASARYRELVATSDSPGVRLALARLQLRQEDDGAVLATLERALAVYPDAADLQVAYAELLAARGDLEAARAAVARYGSRGLAQPSWEYVRARIELAEGRAEAARERLLRISAALDTSLTQYWLGVTLEALGDREGADRRYRAALQRDLSMLDAYRAVLRLAEGRSDVAAVAEFSALMVRFLPALPDGWIALGRARLALGDSEGAERAARQAVARLPDIVALRGLLAQALSAQGRHPEALAVLREAETELGPSAELDAEAGLALFAAGRASEALLRVEASLRERPEAVVLHRVHTALLFGTGQADAGSRAADRVLELEPSDPWPLRERARFFAATGRYEGAERDARRYLEARPDDAELHFVLGVVLQRSDRGAEAIEAYRQAARLDPGAFAPRGNLAELLAERGDLEGALAASQEAYRLAPDDASVLDTLGAVYLRKGVVDRAISFSEQAHQSAPERPDIQLNLARAYGRAGRVDDASRLLSDLESREDLPGPIRADVDEVRTALQ